MLPTPRPATKQLLSKYLCKSALHQAVFETIFLPQTMPQIQMHTRLAQHTKHTTSIMPRTLGKQRCHGCNDDPYAFLFEGHLSRLVSCEISSMRAHVIADDTRYPSYSQHLAFRHASAYHTCSGVRCWEEFLKAQSGVRHVLHECALFGCRREKLLKLSTHGCGQ